MAPPSDPPSSITLRIKVPPGHIPGGADEFTLGHDIPVSCRIGQIRERIQEAIPSSPTPERQRLLHGGRALVDNEQTIADALNIRRDPSQREYVIHLLVKGEGSNTAPVPHLRGTDTPNRSASPAQAGPTAGVPPMAAVPGPPQMQQTAHQQPQQHAGDQQMPPNQAGFHVQGVGPNGERIMVHHQTMNFQHVGQHMQPGPHIIPGMPGAPGVPGLPGMHGLPGMPPFPFGPHPGLPHQHAPRPHGPSALEQARENMVEMRRMLEELRNSATASETDRANVTRMEERTQALNDYIDPLRLSGANNNRSRSQSPQTAAQGQNVPMPPAMNPFLAPPNTQASWQQRAQQIRQGQQQSASANMSSTDVTCYLLSSPLGPQAILHSPQHGTFTGTPQYQAGTLSSGLRPTPTSAVPSNPASPAGDNQAQANQAAVPAQAQANGGQQVQAQVQMQAAQQDPMGPFGPILGHFWLLLRILIFSYFLLGANMGWRRPLALLAIGLGFWMIRAGLLGDGGAVRRWWDGIMNDGQRPAQQPAQRQEGQQQPQPQGQEQQQGQGNGRLGQMPTPEELAQRLLNEDARARDQARNERYAWLRERIRPVERAIALLVASLWPGVGEAYVRAREQEERRRAEEEIAARRREEEERQRLEEEKKQQDEGGEGSESKEKTEGLGETSVTAPTAATEQTAATPEAEAEAGKS